jgi:hypothetical protein
MTRQLERSEMMKALGKSSTNAVPVAKARRGLDTAETQAMGSTAPPVKLLLRVDEARAVLSLNRNAMYRLLMSETIYSFKEGGVRLIPAAELAAYVERRMAERQSIAAAPALRQVLRLAVSHGKGSGYGR